MTINGSEIAELFYNGKEIETLVNVDTGESLYLKLGRVDSPCYLKMVNNTDSVLTFKLYLLPSKKTYIEVEQGEDYTQYPVRTNKTYTVDIPVGESKIIFSYDIKAYRAFNVIQTAELTGMATEFRKTDSNWSDAGYSFGYFVRNDEATLNKRCLWNLSYADTDIKPTTIADYKFWGTKVTMPKFDLSIVTYIGTYSIPSYTQDLQRLPLCKTYNSMHLFDRTLITGTFRLSDYLPICNVVGQDAFSDHIYITKLIWDIQASIPIGCFQSSELIEEVIIEAGNSYFGNYSFGWISPIKKVTWTSPSTTYIGDAFVGCNYIDVVDMRCWEGKTLALWPTTAYPADQYFTAFGLNKNLKIIVPDSLYDQIPTKSTNWATYQKYLVKASEYQET